jgi:transcriptional regulator with GAF, ATPase, and Fis domain
LERRGTFREDFFYRIATAHIHIPPLRERLEDVLPLAEYFLSVEAKKTGRDIPSISDKVQKFLLSCPWRGNVRELKNAVTCAMAFMEGSTLEMGNFGFQARKVVPVQEAVQDRQDCPKECATDSQQKLSQIEKQAIVSALENSLWIQNLAAAKLGISPRVLNYKIRKFSITHPRWRKNTKKGRETSKESANDNPRIHLEKILGENKWSLAATARELSIEISELKKIIREQGIEAPQGVWFGNWIKKK